MPENVIPFFIYFIKKEPDICNTSCQILSDFSLMVAPIYRFIVRHGANQFFTFHFIFFLR